MFYREMILGALCLKALFFNMLIYTGPQLWLGILSGPHIIGRYGVHVYWGRSWPNGPWLLILTSPQDSLRGLSGVICMQSESLTPQVKVTTSSYGGGCCPPDGMSISRGYSDSECRVSFRRQPLCQAQPEGIVSLFLGDQQSPPWLEQISSCLAWALSSACVVGIRRPAWLAEYEAWWHRTGHGEEQALSFWWGNWVRAGVGCDKVKTELLLLTTVTKGTRQI